LLLGGVFAAIIACGGASHKSAMAPPGPMADMGHGNRRAEIDALDKAIDDEFAKRQVTRPVAPPNTCVGAACPMVASTVVKPTADPTCHPATSDTCQDSCKFADSICENAGKICDIASQLGGNDAYANEKCGSGKASCDASRERCCGCQL
jgi:hypothetical protein